MTKRINLQRACVRLCAALLITVFAAATLSTNTTAKKSVRQNAMQQTRIDIHLRSLTTRATGTLTIVASEGGGHARLTTMNLPDPRTVAEGATTYVVWAVSGGRIFRLGELEHDQRGNGGLAFERPAEFERYSVIVTAEQSAGVERPGDPVLTTRADEAAALYPTKIDESAAAASATPTPQPPVPDTYRPRRSHSRAGDFYSEVDDALAANGGGRQLELEGDSAASQARGAARATLRSNRAYVRANFRGVPLPSRVGASVYLLWAITPGGRIIYMGSLPADDSINTAEIYVRVEGFDADDYTLFVTAERARPASTPSGRRILNPRLARMIVK
jgi:hypothetical protein